MTIWSPNYRVKVNGVTVTGATLSGLTITSGRTDIYSQAIAGYCNLTLLETNKSAITFEINDSVTVEVQNSTSTYVYLFGGFITDINVVVETSGSSALTQKIQIIAVGALARLNRTIFSGNFSHEFDGTRIAGLLDDVLYSTWNDIPGTTTWANYDATTTWLNAENAGYGEVDTPGDYELHSQTGVSDTIYNLVVAAANSGLGYIYEDSQGRIGYADSTHRSEYLAANGYIDLDGNHAIGPALQISKRAGDIRNSVTIGYGADSSSEVTDSDAASIILYGELASRVSTTLRHQADAEAQAAYYLLIRAYPQFQMSQMTFALGNPEIDNADRDSLLAVFMGMPLNISNLPSNMIDGSFQGFVEGWTWSAGLNSLNLTLTISPIAYSLQAFRWNSVPITETYNTISPTLQWLDATIVA